jgi:hypothetical protein
MDDGLMQPAALPEQVLKSRRAIDMFMIAVIGMVGIGLIAVIGAIVLAFFGREIPGEVWPFAGARGGGDCDDVGGWVEDGGVRMGDSLRGEGRVHP